MLAPLCWAAAPFAQTPSRRHEDGGRPHEVQRQMARAAKWQPWWKGGAGDAKPSRLPQVAPAAAGATGRSAHAAALAVVPATAALLLGRHSRRGRGAAPWRRLLRQRCRPQTVGVALAAAAREGVLDFDTRPDEEELTRLFQEICGDRRTIAFEDALRLQGIEVCMLEEVVTIQELQVLWGEKDERLDFEDFTDWYCSTMKLYEEMMFQDAVAPPSELLEDLDDEDVLETKEYSEEELLSDAPAQQDISTLGALDEAEMGMQSGQAGEKVSRQNVDVTRLFRERCDENNQLSWQSLQAVSEISDLLGSEDLTKDELRDMWSELPKKDEKIDILGFRDLMAKIDELFEYVEDDGTDGLRDIEEEAITVGRKARDPKVVKRLILEEIEKNLKVEQRACGLDGRGETDRELTSLVKELEQVWRGKYDGDFEAFDTSDVVGEWELIYSTSLKFRRYQSIMNTGSFKPIPNGEFEELVINFSMSADAIDCAFDMEEAFRLKDSDESELCMRALGTWVASIASNPVTGQEDLVLKMKAQQIEYEKEEDPEQREETRKNVLTSQMVRTLGYAFITFVDDELFITSSDLMRDRFFIFRKLEEDDDDESSE